MSERAMVAAWTVEVGIVPYEALTLLIRHWFYTIEDEQHDALVPVGQLTRLQVLSHEAAHYTRQLTNPRSVR